MVFAIACMLFTTFAYADKPILDVSIPSSNKGNSWAEGNLLIDALKRMGYDSEVVHTKKCVNNKSYMAKDTGRPAIFVRSASRYVKDESRDCNVEINKDNFITVFYKRHQTMCVRADESFTNINDFLSGKTRVTVAVTHSSTDGIFDNLSHQTGVRFVPVKVKGSKNIIKSLIAGDTDLMYSGLTKREIGTKQINCFTTSASEEVAGRPSMSTLFPNWNLNSFGAIKYFHAVNIPAEQMAKVKADLNNITKDIKIKPYLASAYMTPGSAINNQYNTFWKAVEILTGKKVASK
jgi:tripartite-type tricarboxylate transporter receptor subunit TctC